MKVKYHNGQEIDIHPGEIPNSLKAMHAQFDSCLAGFRKVLGIHSDLLEGIQSTSCPNKALSALREAEKEYLPILASARADFAQGLVLFKDFTKKWGASSILIEYRDGIHDPCTVETRIAETEEVIAHLHHKCTKAYREKRLQWA